MTAATELVLDRYYPESHKRFLADTAKHAMSVVHEDGLYRHIKFRDPDSYIYWFDLITWPGNLVIRGDMGSFGFARVDDMFGFFHSSYINPSYWSEKLHIQAGAKEYSQETFVANVRARWEEARAQYSDEEQGAIGMALDVEVLDPEISYYKDAAYDAASAFSCHGFELTDWFDVDVDDYTVQFLWCCHAIRVGVAHYLAAKSGGAS